MFLEKRHVYVVNSRFKSSLNNIRFTVLISIKNIYIPKYLCSINNVLYIVAIELYEKMPYVNDYFVPQYQCIHLLFIYYTSYIYGNIFAALKNIINKHPNVTLKSIVCTQRWLYSSTYATPKNVFGEPFAVKYAMSKKKKLS